MALFVTMQSTLRIKTCVHHLGISRITTFNPSRVFWGLLFFFVVPTEKTDVRRWLLRDWDLPVSLQDILTSAEASCSGTILLLIY